MIEDSENLTGDTLLRQKNTQIEDPNDHNALLRQVDDDLARLTASEADYALNA